MSPLQAALTAIRTSQVALQTIGNNLANEKTPGYHRQQVEVVDRKPLLYHGMPIGQGVEVGQIKRLRDASVESALLQTAGDKGRLSAELETLRHLESLQTPGDGTLYNNVQDFFNRWELLAADPAEGVRRQEVLQSATDVANSINSLSGNLRNLKTSLVTEIEAAVDEINRLSSDVADLNREILMTRGRGVDPNDLLDRRDQLVSQLAELLDAEVIDTGNGEAVQLAKGSSFITTGTRPLEVVVDGVAGVQIYLSGMKGPIQLSSGRLAGLVNSHNTLVSAHEDQLKTLTSELVGVVNSVHAAGLGAGGGITHFLSDRTIIPASIPLNLATSDFPIESGDLFIGVVNDLTGVRTVHRVLVNPYTNSLNDVGAALDALGGIHASADATTGQLRIDADAGFRFDFTGALPSQATVDAATGTSIPAVSGQYLGSGNDEWSMTVVGSGQVGADADLTIELRNQSGVLIGMYAVGAGYAPGDKLQLPMGVALRVPPGTLNHGDTFRLPVVAQPDAAGFLAAIGAHDLFTGTVPGTIGINEEILNNITRLSVTQTGEPGDNRIAVRLADLGKQPLLANGTLTFVEYLSWASGRTGLEVVHTTDELGGVTQLSEYYAAERASVSGVSPDEELVRMLEFQRMFQSAAQFISSVNETYDELFNVFR